MRSFKGASLRCGRPAMNRADPKHELNKNIFVRSGLGIILDKNKTPINCYILQEPCILTNSDWVVHLPLQKSWIHHIDRQKCIV